MAPPAASAAIPPALPPSVEEAYRRKCIQLRARTLTVTEANEAARIRLLRMRRGIEKMRLERAFLLEQVERRVKIAGPDAESSEGSPSPPPTPKQKPLRVKRGRRGPDFLAQNGLENQMSQDDREERDNGASFNDSMNESMQRPEPEPRSTQPSQSPGKRQQEYPNSSSADRPPVNPRPRGAGAVDYHPGGYELFDAEMRSVLLVKNRREARDGKYDVDKDLTVKWNILDEGKKAEYRRRAQNGEEPAALTHSQIPGHNGADEEMTEPAGDMEESEDVQMDDGYEQD